MSKPPPELTSFYRIHVGWAHPPEEVKVHRFSASSVWLYHGPNTNMDRHTRRISDYECYYPTLEEAIDTQVAALNGKIAFHQKKIMALQTSISETQSYLDSIETGRASGKMRFIAYPKPVSFKGKLKV
jgi:hypothetical protein